MTATVYTGNRESSSGEHGQMEFKGRDPSQQVTKVPINCCVTKQQLSVSVLEV